MFRVDVAVAATLLMITASVSSAAAAGLSFGDPKALNTNAEADTGSDSNPAIAGDGAGNYVVVWESTDSLRGTIDGDSDILVTRSSDAGVTWSEPASLAPYAKTDISHDSAPTILTDGKGIWAVAWSSNNSLGDKIGDDVDTLIAYSTDNGATWTAPTALYPSAAQDRIAESSPTLATDGHGNWGAAFVARTLEQEPGASVQRNIFTTFRKNGESAWSDPVQLNPVLPPEPANDHTSASIGVDEKGNWLVVWRRVIGVKADFYAARSNDTGETWSQPRTVNSAVGATSSNYGSIIRTDGKNWATVWVSGYSEGGRLGKDRDVVFAHSTDAGATWSRTREVNQDAATDSRSSNDELPAVATGGGGWIVVWSHQQSDGSGEGGSDNDLRASVSADGLTWSPPVAVNNDQADDQSHDLGAGVAGDAAGNWVVVWARATQIPSQYGTDRDLFFAIGKGSAANPKDAVDLARKQ